MEPFLPIAVAAVRETAINNRNCYGYNATEAIMKNLCVENLLRLVEDEECAKNPAWRIEKMYTAGGFKLTKFVRCNKLVLMRIPESHRRKSLKELSKLRTVKKKSSRCRENIVRSLSGGVELGYNGVRKISEEMKMMDIWSHWDIENWTVKTHQT